MDLFEHSRKEEARYNAPLAARMRPRTLRGFIGQKHITGPGRLLRRAIEADRLFSSLIFWGPPGVGKTTLAMIIANTTKAHFETLSAVLNGIADLRSLVNEAKQRRGMYGQRTILLVDEIHRWNKAQQDGLLPVVEDGTITLIGATTENPYFSIISPLLSRSRIFRFDPLTQDQIHQMLTRALQDSERGYGEHNVKVTEEALEHLAAVAGGDVRSALNALELAVESTPPDEEGVRHITLEVAEESIQQRTLQYDKSGDEHYDTISAFIKSIRGSDPDAALYYLAKMVSAGEDPRFILRRLLILAAEDVGLASPMAIAVVTGCAQAFEWVGMPEGQYHLAEATLYLATAPKSNSVGAYWDALHEIEERGYKPPPIYLRDKHTSGLYTSDEAYPHSLSPKEETKNGAHQTAYKYPHNYPGGWVPQRYLPEGVKGDWFHFRGHGYEKQIANRLKQMKQPDKD